MSQQPFQERWRIGGTLTTQTPLRIGSGHSTTTAYENLIKNEIDNTAVTVDEILFDANGKPYLSATALKGNLRRWLQDRLFPEQQKWLESIFGSETQDQESVGGKAHFLDARLVANPIENLTDPPPSYWNAQRQAAVAVGVTIDRITRTALEKHLFHREIVPPHATFSLHIHGQGLNETEMALLLAGLEGFNDSNHPVTLGSDTAQHQGRLLWQLHTLEKIDEASAKAWLEQDSTDMGYHAFKPIDPQPFCRSIPQWLAPKSSHATLQFEFQLTFDSPFLVNDPSLYQPGDTPETTTPHHQPKYDAHGKPVLPARSLRGAIRSQAERIIRTLGKTAGFLEETVAIEKMEQVKKLDWAAQLFGAPGWKTPIEISDFTLVDNSGIPFSQEFVAVDRFTGGGGKGLKFNVKAIYQPRFKGEWQIDLERVEPWGLGLLALVIRDLCEGDITFGFGAGKGYGHCRASVQKCSVNHVDKVANKFGLTEEEVKLITQESLDVKSPLIKSVVNRFLEKWRAV